MSNTIYVRSYGSYELFEIDNGRRGIRFNKHNYIFNPAIIGLFNGIIRTMNISGFAKVIPEMYDFLIGKTRIK